MDYKKLGDYIEPVDERNSKLEIKLSQGICNEKYFQDPRQVAENSAADKIVRHGYFAYNRATTRNGEKISIAYREGPDCTVSSAYQVFRIKDEEKLNPKYLLMWYKRSDFDRYARFKSHGSAHEFFEYDEMCDIRIPLPPIERQCEIVEEYETLTNRIRLNEQMIQKLEATAQSLYRKTFVDVVETSQCGVSTMPKGWRKGTLGEVCQYVNDKVSLTEIDESKYISTENMLKDKKGIALSKNKPNESRGTRFRIDDILISNIRPYFKKIWRATFSGGSSNDVLCFRTKNNFNPSILYYTLEQDAFFNYVMAGSNGVKMPRGDKDWIMKYPIIIPSQNVINSFQEIISDLHKHCVCCKYENEKLTELQSLLLAKMGQYVETPHCDVSTTITSSQ